MEKTFLCTCIACLKVDPNGMLLNQNTYNRHRRRQQENEEKEENLMTSHQEESFESQVEDIYQQQNNSRIQTEDMQIEYINKHDQEEYLDLIDLIDENSDTESFNIINEEDNEDYSDYNEDDDGEDDDDENEDIDEDIMQIDDKPDIYGEKIIEGLRLLHLKSLYNFTESAYDDIMKIFTIENVSLYKVKTYLKDVTNLIPEFYDMCENSCICYTGNYEAYTNCPICDASRLDVRGKAKKVMPYLSVKDRLKIQFNDENRAKELLYRYEYTTNKNDDDLDDIFDGKIYKELVEKDLFNDKRDIAFTTSCDGYQIFKQKTDDCWLFLMINNNLDPSIRVKKENLLVPFLIPGPKQPKDFNSFLRPFVNEMKELESK
jgi:Transposase family tnp2